MTVQPGRRLVGLTFDLVEDEIKREHQLVDQGEEFLDNLCHVKVYRDREGWGLGAHEVCYTALEFLDANDFDREDFRAEDWVLHDTLKPASVMAELDAIDEALADADKKLLSRDDVQTAVSFALGRFYYSNPDSHKIVPEILKRLGF